MSLVPVKEYTDANALLADIAARKRRFAALRPPPPVEPRKPHPSLLGVRMKGDPDPIEVEAELKIRDWLSLVDPALRRPTDLKRILNIVTRMTGFTALDLRGERRTRHLVICRHIAFYMMREHTTSSYPSIGQFLGGKDHTTVLHGCNRIARLIEADPAIAAIVREIAMAIEADKTEAMQ